MQTTGTQFPPRSSLKSVLALACLAATLAFVLAVAAIFPAPAMAASTSAVSIVVDADLTGADEASEADSGERDDQMGTIRPESIVPGVNDILDAELGPWWLVDQADALYPENPHPLGPYA